MWATNHPLRYRTLLSVFTGALLILPASSARAGVTLQRDESAAPVTLELGGKTLEGFVVVGGRPLNLTATGPGSLGLELMRKLPAKKPAKAGTGVVAVVIDGAGSKTVKVKPKPGRAKVTGSKEKLGKSATIRLDISDGQHQIEIAVAPGDRYGVVVLFDVTVRIVAPPAKAAVEPPPPEPRAEEETVAVAVAAAAVDEPEPGPGPDPGATLRTTEGGSAPEPGVDQPAVSGSEIAPSESEGTEVIEATSATTSATPPVAEVTSDSGAPAGEAATGPAFSLGVGVRLGVYHPLINSDLDASFALGGDLRAGLPILPPAIGKLGVAVSASWQQFSREKTLSDDELGDFTTRYSLSFIPITVEAYYQSPELGPIILYGGAAFALYVAMSSSEGFGAQDNRTTVLPGFQAFGGVGLPLGPFLVGVEIRYTNVTVDFSTGTVGSGDGYFGQAVGSFQFL